MRLRNIVQFAYFVAQESEHRKHFLEKLLFLARVDELHGEDTLLRLQIDCHGPVIFFGQRLDIISNTAFELAQGGLVALHEEQGTLESVIDGP